ncbi:MFS transporter [Paraburkholderia oxyphila]|uniref:MFS transporter n=1 Tax=Paraburkholderia oxyphila TaxID=614212 RepID=UPI0004830878|nr:aromatic acid/H+ symport family MFS transporter [Paraburkholderia oxyphila]
MSINIVDSVVEESRVNSFHLMILCWGSMLMLFDGYDLVVYGSVLPTLMTEWKLSAVTAGIIGSSALFGMMIGALTLGSSADRFGRRRLIIACLVVIGLAGLANGFCESPTQFIFCRLFTGIGLGGMIPNIVALMTEMSPRSRRNIMVTAMLSFFSVGGIVAALTSKMITPSFGWRANFFVAALPLFALPILVRWLPESVAFLLSNRMFAEADRLLRKLAPGYNGTAELLASTGSAPSTNHAKSRALRIFEDGRGRNTLLIWIAFGMCMLMVYGLSTWLPKLMTANGYTLGSSLTFLVTLNFGAVIGGLLSGWLADRWGGKGTLILFFGIAAASISLIGYKQTPIVLDILLMLAGATTIGTLCIVHSFASLFYPASIRSTGVGWAAAAGRLGAVAGPALGGYLFSQNLPINVNFVVFAVPGVVAALAIALTSSTQTRKTVNSDVAVAVTQPD